MATRLPDEPDDAYTAYGAYEAQGPRRSRRVLADQLNIPVEVIGVWFREYDWPRRVAAYDREELVKKVQAVDQEAEQRHKIGTAARGLFLQGLRNVDPDTMSLFDLNQLGQLASQLLDED